jgi:hypothetical protein
VPFAAMRLSRTTMSLLGCNRTSLAKASPFNIAKNTPMTITANSIPTEIKKTGRFVNALPPKYPIRYNCKEKYTPSMKI